MSEARPSAVYATSSTTSKRSLWKRATNDITNMITSTTSRKSVVQSESCLDGQAEQELSLSEMLDYLERLARQESRQAVRYLRELLAGLEGCETIKCTLNKMLLKGRVELHVQKKHTESLNFRATNALHLSGSELQMNGNLSFEATLVDDGILLTNVTGLSVKVIVLKGTFRCEVLQARIQSNDKKCMLRLKTRNPLIGKSADDLSQVDLLADVYQSDVSADEVEQLKVVDLLERRETERKLRKTANRMKAFDLQTLNRVAQATIGVSVSPKDNSWRFEWMKMIITVYAVSLVLVASYFHLMTKVPPIVSIAMTLSAVSFLILGCERTWTLKSDLAVLLNLFSMTVVTNFLYNF